MNALDWMVIAGGIAAIAWLNWYFFIAGRRPADAATAGSNEIVITVDGGYAPATVRVKSGQRVRLVFDRKDTSSCSEEVVFPDFGIRRYLPTGERTTIDITPPHPGRYEFTCGMSMLHGALIAEA